MISKNVPIYRAGLFSWKAGLGTSEISTLHEESKPFMGRLWLDACDVGFWLESDKTGKRMLFSLESQDQRDGEIVAWNMVSQDLTLRLTIFNT